MSTFISLCLKMAGWCHSTNIHQEGDQKDLKDEEGGAEAREKPYL
jgi:hypothetical protein